MTLMQPSKTLGIVSTHNKYTEVVRDIFSKMNVALQGTGPCDIRVHDDGFYKRFIRDGSLGLGESYMDGWWDCERLDELFARIARSNLSRQLRKNPKVVLFFLRARFSNVARKSRAFEIGERHYDLGNELFQNMLDSKMIYSCGHWEGTTSLGEAQENKLRMICNTIGLKSGMRILDIGCGWGGFAKFAAEHYGARVVGITVSKKQLELGQEMCAGLPIELRLQDYRDVEGEFDRIVSMGMFEHVGYKNHKAYMKIVHRCLKEEGIFFLETIGRSETAVAPDPWIEKYIFPNSLSPSIKQIADSTEGLWIMEDWDNCGTDYDKTLMSWHENFRRNWTKIQHEYDDRFYRMWSYFLLMCAGLFRSRYVQPWQIVFTKQPGVSPSEP